MRYRSSDQPDPAAVGRRVTVRYRLPDGRASDVIGLLESLDEEVCTIRRRDGEQVRIERARILAFRVVRAQG